MTSGGANRLSVAALKARGTLRADRHQPQAICQWCDRHYRPASEGCAAFFVFEGVRIDRIPFEDLDLDTRCPDCGVAVGEVHHGRCDEEICPKCGQLMTASTHPCDPEVWL